MDAAALAHASDDVLWRLRGVMLAGRALPRLNDVTLDIAPGLTAVLGESGAGKTSLLNLLVGFERPCRGEMDFALQRRQTARRTGAAAQPLFWAPPDHGLWPHRTVRRHLLNGDASLLPAFGLADVADAYPSTLSAGERSRLSVMRAVSSAAAVLVLDEPFANVDPALQSRLWPMLFDLTRRQQQSVVFSTHQPSVAVGYADGVICLNSGRVVAAGVPRELYHRPPNREVAERFGRCNWLPADEAPLWLPGVPSPCVRPEQLAIEPDDSSPFRVEAVTFCGEHEDVLLQHAAGPSRRFLHRPARPQLQPGQHVLLRLLSVCAVLLGCLGCEPGGEVPLTVRTEDVWTLPPEGAKYPAPRAITAGPQGDAFVLDNAGRVLVLNNRGDCVRKWWMPEYSVGKPERVLVCRDGTLAIADTHYHRVVLFDPQGHLLTMFGRHGEGPGEFIYPVAIAEDDRQRLYVCEYGGHDRVQVFQKDGTYLREFGSFGTTPGQFQRPSGILWRNGRLFIVDAFNNRVQVFQDDGRLVDLPREAFAAELHYPYDIAAGPDGSLYVVEYGAGRVTKFSSEGKLLGRCGATGDGAGRLSRPWGLGVDDLGRVLVADTENRRVVRWEFRE